MAEEPGGSDGRGEGIDVEVGDIGIGCHGNIHTVADGVSADADFVVVDQLHVIFVAGDFQVVCAESRADSGEQHILSGDEDAATVIEVGADGQLVGGGECGAEVKSGIPDDHAVGVQVTGEWLTVFRQQVPGIAGEEVRCQCIGDGLFGCTAKVIIDDENGLGDGGDKRVNF